MSICYSLSSSKIDALASLISGDLQNFHEKVNQSEPYDQQMKKNFIGVDYVVQNALKDVGYNCSKLFNQSSYHFRLYKIIDQNVSFSNLPLIETFIKNHDHGPFLILDHHGYDTTLKSFDIVCVSDLEIDLKRVNKVKNIVEIALASFFRSFRKIKYSYVKIKRRIKTGLNGNTFSPRTSQKVSLIAKELKGKQKSEKSETNMLGKNALEKIEHFKQVFYERDDRKEYQLKLADIGLEYNATFWLNKNILVLSNDCKPVLSFEYMQNMQSKLSQACQEFKGLIKPENDSNSVLISPKNYGNNYHLHMQHTIDLEKVDQDQLTQVFYDFVTSSLDMYDAMRQVIKIKSSVVEK